MNEKNLNAVQIRNDIVNLEKPFFYNNQIVIITQHTGRWYMLIENRLAKIVEWETQCL